MRAVVLALVLVGCASGGGVVRRDSWGVHVVDESGTVDQIVGSDACNNIYACPAFDRWFRPEWDGPGPVYWLVSTGGRACVVNGKQFAMANTWHAEPARCKWRSGR